MKVAMIGCGKLGIPCANVMSQHHDVIGYDTKYTPPHEAGILFNLAATLEEAVEGRDIIFVAVPTPHHDGYGGEEPTHGLAPADFNYSAVVGVLKSLDALCTKDQLVVLISTVLPGTTRELFSQHTGNYRFVYNPYLIAMGSVEWDMAHPEMVIIGTKKGQRADREALDLISFYQTMMLNDPEYVVGTWDEAECIKIFYNTFISTKIALVNMIQDVAQESGNINVDVVTKALAHSTKRIMSPAYMRAGMGDGGSCHPRDNIALRYLSKKLELGYDLFGAIVESREKQAARLARELIRHTWGHPSRPIFIHGKSFKPGVPYCEGSYSLLVGHYVQQFSGMSVQYIDPLAEKTVYDTVHGVILMAHHAPTTYSHSHTVGEERQKFYCKFAPGSVIVDVWRYLTQDDVPECVLVQYGNTREV